MHRKDQLSIGSRAHVCAEVASGQVLYMYMHMYVMGGGVRWVVEVNG